MTAPQGKRREGRWNGVTRGPGERGRGVEMTPGVTSEEDPCLQVCSGSSDLALAWAALQGNEDTPCQRSHGPSTPTLCALGVLGTLAAGTLAVGATSVDSLFPCLPLGLTSRRPRQKWGDGG